MIDFETKEITYIFDKEVEYRCAVKDFRLYGRTEDGFERYEHDLKKDHLRGNRHGDLKNLVKFMREMNKEFKVNGDN